MEARAIALFAGIDDTVTAVRCRRASGRIDRFTVVTALERTRRTRTHDFCARRKCGSEFRAIADFADRDAVVRRVEGTVATEFRTGGCVHGTVVVTGERALLIDRGRVSVAARFCLGERVF